MHTILIGIDDTDNETSRGTGHLARQLAKACEERGLAPLGVTRHQFLIAPRIPYTSHNSGACVAVSSTNGIAAAEFAFDFVAERSATGSDPGVCVAQANRVPAAVTEFGSSATKRVLEIKEAERLAESTAVALRALGGTGQGVIGALGAVGLRAAGNEGRFIDLPGLRALTGRVRAVAFTSLGIMLDYQSDGHRPSPDDPHDTLDWIRPRLVNGKPVLPVEWSVERDAWIPVDRKRSRPLE